MLSAINSGGGHRVQVGQCHAQQGDQYTSGSDWGPHRLVCSLGMRTPTRVKLALAAMYAANVAISYLLMLAVMTYNVGYFIVIVLGLAAGHLAFFGEASATAAPDACCATPLP